MLARVLALVIAFNIFLAPSWGFAEIHRVEVTLFSPCVREKAEWAVAALEGVPGVEKVSLSPDGLAVSVETGGDFSADPLELVQKLWDGQIYPNKIRLVASGRIESGDGAFVFHTAGTGQRFEVRDDESLRRFLAEHGTHRPVRITGEITDWIEDQQLDAGQLYTLRVLEYSGG